MPDLSIRRILMTTDTVGGVWTFTIELSRCLTRLGIEVILASMGAPPSAHQRTEAETIPNLTLLASNYKLEWMEDPWSDLDDSGKWLLQLERKSRPNLIHLNSLAHGSLPWSAPSILTVHSCVLSWWSAVHHEPAPDTWNRYRDLVTRSLHAATFVTAPTKAFAATLTDHYNYPEQQCFTIPNGRDSSLFIRAPKEPFVLTAGRLWDPAKNTSAVANAASSLPWPVCAAGNAEHPNGGAAHFPGTHLLGSLTAPELAQWMSRASIFALPARYEPFGLTPLEAALSGCALVLGDIPTQHEIWGDAALFAAPGDRASLIAAISSLIDSPQLLREMSERAYRRAFTFDSATTANLYLDAYALARTPRELQCAS